MSDQYGSFDTHIAILYDIFCHMTYVIKWRFMIFYDICHMTWDVIKYANMGIKRTVSIRQIDLWGSEPLESNKIMKKMQKTEMTIFPLYFWPNSYVKYNRQIANLNVEKRYFKIHFLVAKLSFSFNFNYNLVESWINHILNLI